MICPDYTAKFFDKPADYSMEKRRKAEAKTQEKRKNALPFKEGIFILQQGRIDLHFFVALLDPMPDVIDLSG